MFFHTLVTVCRIENIFRKDFFDKVLLYSKRTPQTLYIYWNIGLTVGNWSFFHDDGWWTQEVSFYVKHIKCDCPGVVEGVFFHTLVTVCRIENIFRKDFFDKVFLHSKRTPQTLYIGI